jgi:hypothetical protein
MRNVPETTEDPLEVIHNAIVQSERDWDEDVPRLAPKRLGMPLLQQLRQGSLAVGGSSPIPSGRYSSSLIQRWLRPLTLG